MWLFGYGSLIWKVDFPVEEKIIGYIEGYHRRFCQKSVDHRGTPEFPGRVVTLIPTTLQNSKVYGVAYRIKEENIESVLQHLDYREKGGYERVYLTFSPKDNTKSPFEVLVYFGSDKNPNFDKNWNVESVVNVIVRAVGPSGTNLEYLFNLAESMRNIAPDVDDDHLYALEKSARWLTDKGTPENSEIDSHLQRKP